MQVKMILNFVFHKRWPQSVVVVVAAGLGVALRLLAVPPVVGDVDGVNFARSLQMFDVQQQAPHFPGYPVYVALARLMAWMMGAGHDVAAQALSLSLPGIVLWPVAAWVLFVGLSRVIGRNEALLVSVGCSLAPGAVIPGGWPGSDGLGMALLCIALGLMGLQRMTWSGLVWGVLLGVRLAWIPVLGVVGLTMLIHPTGRVFLRPWSVGVLMGMGVWAAPMLMLVGLTPLVTLARGFITGHFATWGGTAISTVTDAASQGDGLLLRCLRVIWDMWHAALGAPWLGDVPMQLEAPLYGHAISYGCVIAEWLVAAGLMVMLISVVRNVLLKRAPDISLIHDCMVMMKRVRPVWWCAAGVGLTYAAWLVVGQNVLKPRHVVPLLPWMFALIGALWTRAMALSGPGRQRVIAYGSMSVLLGAMGTVSFARAAEQGRTLPVPAALAQYVMHHHEPMGLQLFAGEEAHVLQHVAPMYRVLRAQDGDVMRREINRLTSMGIDVWITSGVPGFATLPRQSLHVLSHFETWYVLRGWDANMVLYRWQPMQTPNHQEHDHDDV